MLDFVLREAVDATSIDWGVDKATEMILDLMWW